MTTKKQPFKDNKNEIKYHVVNCLIAGGLVFVGTIADGSVTNTGILASIGAALLVCLIKFKTYWASQEDEYTNKILTFI